MKNRILGVITTSFIFLLTAPASADSIVQLWSCKLHDGKTPADVAEASSSWLAAAKSMEGGKDLKVFLEYPIAADAGLGDFTFVLIAPDTKTWGLFNNDYSDSAVAEADEAWNKVANCSSSSIWASVEIE